MEKENRRIGGVAMTVTIARHLLIVVAIITFPIYAAWLGCGWVADRLAQRRTLALLKGHNDRIDFKGV
jgi:hypothetical protein